MLPTLLIIVILFCILTAVSDFLNGDWTRGSVCLLLTLLLSGLLMVVIL